MKSYSEKSKNQEDLFSTNNIRYECVIIYENNFSTFNIEICNDDIDRAHIWDIVFWRMTDYAYSEDIIDFIIENGYYGSVEEIKKGERYYNEGKKICEAFSMIFESDEMIEIFDDIRNGTY